MSFYIFMLLLNNIQASFLSHGQTEKLLKGKEQDFLQFGICALQTNSPRTEELNFWIKINLVLCNIRNIFNKII